MNVLTLAPDRDAGWRALLGHAGVRTAALWLTLVACIVAWVMPQISIDYRRARWREPEALLLLPTGKYLDAVSLGYQSVLSDVLYLWSIQYYGHHRTREGRRYLWRIFDVITDLDPLYQDAYLTGALIMAVDMGDAESAIRLLDKGAANNPGEWIYPLEAGYYAWMNLGDYARAAEYFARAMRYEQAPPMVERLHAAMTERLGDRQQALRLWLGIYAEAERDGDEQVMSIAWQHVYDLKVDIDLEMLGEAIERFRADRGRPPRVLSALVSQGYLRVLPNGPTGEPYRYDPVTGRVTDPRAQGSRATR